MLKPSSTSNMDQDYVEYYPHIVFLHNKAELQDFTPNAVERIKVINSLSNKNPSTFEERKNIERNVTYGFAGILHESIFQL